MCVCVCVCACVRDIDLGRVFLSLMCVYTLLIHLHPILSDASRQPLLTQALVHAPLLALAAAVLLQAGQPPDTGEAQLLVDEEEEDGQQDHEDAHSRKEANGLRRQRPDT